MLPQALMLATAETAGPPVDRFGADVWQAETVTRAVTTAPAAAHRGGLGRDTTAS